MRPGPILLVEDDRDIREILAEALEVEGFNVVVAANGLEALALIRSLPSRPSAILLDLMMPVLDGYGFLDERRKDSTLASIPVAIITAGHAVDSQRVDRDTAIIPKPIDMSRLVSVLAELRSGSEAQG
jgi:two-component system chemotaxis response regulator CheY